MTDGEDQVRVRTAAPSDEPALARLDAEAWSPDSGFPSVIARSGGFFSEHSPPSAHLIAEVEGRLVGYIRIQPVSALPENAHVLGIAGLAVAPAARGAGIGAALLAAAEAHARSRGARKLSLRVLGTNAAARRLYERLGFEAEGVLRDEFLINGRYVDDLLMAKPLTGPPASPS